jgi:phospholipase C
MAVALIASACVASAGSDEPTTPSISDTPDVYAPAKGVDAGRFETRWPIKHVIFLIKENRTFDQIFGRFPGANGVTVGLDRNGVRPLTPEPDDHPDIVHCWGCSLQAYRDGNMDGFAQGPTADAFAYTQFRPWDIPNLWYLAENYALSDNFFASAWGPSFPNHLFTIAATNAGAHDAPKPPFSLYQQRIDAGFAKTWGCDSPEGTTVKIYDSEGEVTEVPPCFDFLTEGDLLNEKGIPWAYYAPTNTQYGYIWSSYSAIRRYRENPQLWARHMRPVDDVFRDIRKGSLPPVTWIVPRGEVSDHVGGNSWCNGYNWTTKVVNSLMESTLWEDTALFITWDDYGGFYDHVPPRQVDPNGFGFRVPLLTISPYAKQGYIDSRVGEFSSVLRFIEDNWGLPQLTARDRAAKNLSYNFDFTQEPRPPLDPMPLRTTCPGPVFPPPDNLPTEIHGGAAWLPDQTLPDGSMPATPAPAP